MGLLSKVFAGSTALLLVLVGILYVSTARKGVRINELESDIKKTETIVEMIVTKCNEDSLNHSNQLREMQSVMAQLLNQKKSVERENVNLRKGVRLDLLTIRQRRNGKAIDSTIITGYKYLQK
jgi:hypothetical protein